MYRTHPLSAESLEYAVCVFGGGALSSAARSHAMNANVQDIAACSAIRSEGGALSAEELAVCHAAGIEPADFMAAKRKDNAPSVAALSTHERAVCDATGTDYQAFIAARARA